MAENSNAPRPGTPKMEDYVYEGVWEKHGETFLRRWIWTVPDAKALFIFGCFGLLLAFSQSRSWALIRHAICSRKKTIRLNSNDPEPLRHLSQTKAVLDVLPFLGCHISHFKTRVRRLFQVRSPSGSNSGDTIQFSDCPIISPWFGIFALLNICVFLVMSVGIPWQLSEGTLGTAVVRSKLTKDCVASDEMDDTSAEMQLIMPTEQQEIKTDAIFQMCHDQLNQGCDSKFHLQQPQITKSRIQDCFFPAPICYNRTQPFEIVHRNITAREVGLNHKSTITINHRLTCTPVHLDTFLHFNTNSDNSTRLSISNKIFDRPDWAYDVTLNTRNGPNSFSDDNSGFRMAVEGGLERFHVRPLAYSRPVHIRDELKRDDGASFLVVYRAGESHYNSEIEDPLFASHYAEGKWYYADHEATGLGCLEQFQYYTSTHDFSSSWGLLLELRYEMERHLEEKNDLEAKEDIVQLEIIASALSVHDYLKRRTDDHSPIPLTNEHEKFKNGLPRMAFNMELHDKKEQWITEVETWLMKGILHGMLYLQNGARFKIVYHRDGWTETGHERQSFSFCDRLLFRNGDYTNISWVGLWITIVILVLLCVASFTIERWIKTTKNVIAVLVVLAGLIRKKIIRISGVLTAMFLSLGRKWTPSSLFNWWSQSFHLQFLFRQERTGDDLGESSGRFSMNGLSLN